ncbi:hypothetical protein Glove_465g6 [Diversispora epigaea]|uniref:Zinc finger C3HC4 RING-type domain-containing protein n=1 Tax=Diversispora epigaea TaxID=1348612 RepID=A0A397GQY1_9GLOM|nr:hypothetical protein Glove_465g6 [Diversispora epigaea]
MVIVCVTENNIDEFYESVSSNSDNAEHRTFSSSDTSDTSGSSTSSSESDDKHVFESELRDRKVKCKCELPEFETDNSDTSDSNCSNILPNVVSVKKIHESKDLDSIYSKPKKKRNKNKIFFDSNKAFTVLGCGHTYHRICIEKKLLLTKPNGCPDCGKNVEIITEATTTETDSRCDSESNTSSLVGKMKKQLNIQSQEIIDEEMTDVDNMENKDNDSNIRKFFIDDQDKLSNKKAKPTKPLDREKSLNLKKLIDELIKIDYAESKNEATNQNVINSYFDFGEYKKDNGKEVSNALVFDDVRNQISEVSDGTL